MNHQELGQQIIGLTATLYHVSFGLLRNEADREDAVQSAIEKAFVKSSSLRDDSKLKPWLIRILINECYSILRKKGREIPMETLPERSEEPHDTPSELGEALLSLEENLRLPLMLHYMEGFSIREIAAALRCPKGTVLSRMNRGRKNLRMLLTEGKDDEK